MSKTVEVQEILIDGVTYVPKGSEDKKAEQLDGMTYVIVRTYSAGVFAGYLQSRDGKEVTLRKARRLWYWSGAASLSQLSVDGVGNPSDCKFPCEVDKVDLIEAVEVLEATEKSKASIAGVSIWKA